jgi:hypothetical protein
MIEYIESNARHFGAYTLDDICQVFYRHDYVVYRIGWPCTLFELGTDAHGLTNDYLAVPDSQRALVEHLVHPQVRSLSESKA